jgi:hypothetical protein
VLAPVVGAVLACVAALAVATLLAPAAPSGRRQAMWPGAQSRTLVPTSLAPVASASIGASDRGFWPVRRGASLLTRGGGIHGTFTASGATLQVAKGTLGLSLAAIGRGRRLQALPAVAPTVAADRVVYRHGPIVEFYRNGPYGLEQGFALARRPLPGAGPLELVLQNHGALIAVRARSRILFMTHAGATVLRYGQLGAVDATGRRLPAQMRIHDGAIRLIVNDSDASYPIRIDPFIQQGEKLTGTGFGSSVALSADGDTALVGAEGGAWVFARSGSAWTEQAKLLESGSSGTSVALSANGETALIGDSGYELGVGAAWVFARSGAAWQEQAELTGSGNQSFFGRSVALSSNGETALVGASFEGAAWVFTRMGGTWQEQEKLTSSEGDCCDFGWSVALSSDGNTALIGEFGVQAGTGAAWVFTRSNSIWAQPGQRLRTAHAVPEASRFGWSVALSSDGGTALVGGPDGPGKEPAGAAWVFARSGSTWAQQGEPLTGTGETFVPAFGSSVALSADGDTALVGAEENDSRAGAAWVFTRSGVAWTQQGEALTGGGESGEGFFGSSVALSSDGSTALIGGRGAAAAWVFANPPSVVTGAASAVTQGAATLNGTVSPNGVEVGNCVFEYGTTTSYGSSAPCTPVPGSGTGPVAVSAAIAGLAANTTYHFRVSAANSSSTGSGGDQTFQTPPNHPSVVTGAASSVGVDDAILNATVNPAGGQVGACRFEYGTSSSYGSVTPCTASGQTGESPIAVSGALVGLKASTTYHFRIVASNAGGTSYGDDETFTTAANPPPPPRRIEASMTWRFGWTRRYTIVESLTAHAVPKGAYVELSCRGRGCPFAQHRSATVASHTRCHGKKCTTRLTREGTTVSLTGLFKGRRLDVGAHISVRIVKAGWVGKSFLFTVRDDRAPSVTVACLAPGSSDPGKGC